MSRAFLYFFWIFLENYDFILQAKAFIYREVKKTLTAFVIYVIILLLPTKAKGDIMFRFDYLDKSLKDEYLPLLFDIMYCNMREITSNNLSYGEEKTEFISEVSVALEKEPRKIILCYHGEELAGFLMYYTRENMIMIEELQIVKKYQRTRALYSLCKYMISYLPNHIEYIEAFSYKQNATSIALQTWFGMEIIEETNEKLLHLGGNFSTIKNKIR